MHMHTHSIRIHITHMTWSLCLTMCSGAQSPVPTSFALSQHAHEAFVYIRKWFEIQGNPWE